MCDNVETDRLGKRAALSNGDDISVLDSKGRGAVGGNVLVSLLETTVLLNVVKVVSSDDDCSLHLGGDDLSNQNSSSDGNISSKWALLVDIVSLDGSVRGLDSKTNVLDETHWLLARSLDVALAGNEDCILLLVSLFVLIALVVLLWNANHFDLSNEIDTNSG